MVDNARTGFAVASAALPVLDMLLLSAVFFTLACLTKRKYTSRYRSMFKAPEDVRFEIQNLSRRERQNIYP
jgi:hypothetical protein